ncbi:hypothetical protein [Helicobacter burdigaliensis]|nr:hypothetical protein [Helicobacter burdigaliensis]
MFELNKDFKINNLFITASKCKAFAWQSKESLLVTAKRTLSAVAV